MQSCIMCVSLFEGIMVTMEPDEHEGEEGEEVISLYYNYIHANKYVHIYTYIFFWLFF
jgi:hypothetical protein